MSASRPAPPKGYASWLDLAMHIANSWSVTKWDVDINASSYARAELAELRKERDELRKFSERLTAGILAVGELISESSGVSGLHRNGDEARWDELLSGGQFEGWLRCFSDSEMAIAEQVAAKLRAKKETEP